MTELKQYIKMQIENIFADLNVRYKLKSGDISPLQTRQIDDFECLLEQYVKQNEVEQ